MLVNLSIFPLGKGGSLSSFVAEAVNEIDKSGLDYRLTAMGTIIEGEWDDVMKLIKKIRDGMMKRSERAYLAITIDEKKDKRRRIEAKVKSIEKILEKNLKK